eukprot:2412846-Pyramimonas_sp.AAC.1
MLRDPTGRCCITCHRLANPWSYNQGEQRTGDLPPGHPDAGSDQPPNRHALDLLDTTLLLQLVRAGM